MVRASDFVENGRIQFAALGSVLVGSTILAYARASVRTFLALVDIPLSLIAMLPRIQAQIIEAALGLLPATIAAAFRGAAQFVVSSGPAGYVVAIVIVLASLYPISMVINRVR